MPLEPGSPARGSATGRPVMVLLDALGRRWSLRLLWELSERRLNFRDLREACDGVSPSVLNDRLKLLRGLGLVDLADEGYGLTGDGRDVGRLLTELDRWAEGWAERRPQRDAR